MQRIERSQGTTTGGVSRVGKRGHRLGCGDMQELAGGASPRIGDGSGVGKTGDGRSEQRREREGIALTAGVRRDSPAVPVPGSSPGGRADRSRAGRWSSVGKTNHELGRRNRFGGSWGGRVGMGLTRNKTVREKQGSAGAIGRSVRLKSVRFFSSSNY